MKRKILALFLVLAAHAVAQAVTTATCTFTFVGNNSSPIEYFIEAKNSAGVYVEVTKGPASPITFVAPGVTAGSVLTFRIRARVPNNPATASAPTADLVATVPAATPGNPNVTVVFTQS